MRNSLSKQVKIDKALQRKAIESPSDFSCFKKGRKRIMASIHHDTKGDVSPNLLIRSFYSIQNMKGLKESKRQKCLEHISQHAKRVGKKLMKVAADYEIEHSKCLVYSLTCQYISLTGRI